jgi:adenylate cyclase
VARNGRVVMPLMFDLAPSQREQGYSKAQSVLRPVPEIESASAALGHVNVVPESDGVVRTVPMIVRLEDRSVPAFALALLAEAEPAFRVAESQTGDRLDAGARSVPLELGGRMRIDFVGPRGTFPTYSYADVLSGAIDPATFRDRIVLVGITAKALGDYFTTPGAEGTLVPGVEVHANAVDTLLRGRFLTVQPPAEAALFVLVLAVACGAAFSRLKTLTSGLVAFALVGLTVVVAVARFQGGVLENMVYPPLAVVLTYTGVTTYRVLVEGAERRRVQTLFGRYLKPEVVQQLVAAEGETVKLEGEEKEITVLFADIRGFTAMSEQLEPQEVVAMLNHYLDFMTKVIFKHDGTLDKYIGDCIMAFWNAPHEQPDHALRAVKAALDMQCEMQTALASAPTRDVPPVSFGIGINTGLAVVGNMGSTLRHDFTVIGDAVNFSSRMCGVARSSSAPRPMRSSETTSRSRRCRRARSRARPLRASPTTCWGSRATPRSARPPPTEHEDPGRVTRPGSCQTLVPLLRLGAQRDRDAGLAAAARADRDREGRRALLSADRRADRRRLSSSWS